MLKTEGYTSSYGSWRGTASMRDVLLTFLRREGLETPLLEYRITQAWPEVMGETICHYTRQVFVREGKLQVQLTSAPLRQNLMMEHKRIAQKLNDHVGSYVISDVCFF